jgi:GNAT superfamily N-acetyltransferase
MTTTLPTTRIVDIKTIPERAEDVLFVVDRIFGENYMCLEDIEEYMVNPNHFGDILLTEGDRIIGLALYRFLDDDSREEVIVYNNIFKTYGHSECHVYRHGTITFDTLLVIPEFQGNGFGKAMVQNMFDNVNRIPSAKNMVSISWINDRPVNSDKIFLEFGFKEICVIPEFWLADSIDKEYSCPICGNPCHCAAKFLFHPLEKK